MEDFGEACENSGGSGIGSPLRAFLTCINQHLRE